MGDRGSTETVSNYRLDMQDKFAGGDPEYIRTTQYGTPDKLQARVNLHVRYRTAEVPWFTWMVDQIPWRPGRVVEVGCGTGSFWEEARPPIDGPIVLTDLSEGMVQAATVKAADAGYVVEGQVAAAQDLPFDDGSCAHIISNHMLYHVPHPPDAVAEFARVIADDGVVSVATNGEQHFRALKEIEAAVFATRVKDRTIEAFGITNGQAMLEAQFADVTLLRFPDALHVTSADDLLAYALSYPPGEDATPAQVDHLRAEIDAAFIAGDGTVVVEKDVGLFICRAPRRG